MKKEESTMSDEMKQDIETLKTGVSELLKGMGQFQKDIGEVRKDVGDVKSMLRRTMLNVADLTGEVAGIKHRMATKDDISLLNRRMDKFAGLQSDANVNAARNLHRLDDHDDRLDRLEHPERKS